jgi:tripartite-type tricarboxylate transporter receptor subunit TctC
LATLLGLGAPASAQSYPNKSIHIVVPFVPGGITDILARALGQRLTEAWGQQVVIENKPGANSQVGTEFVAKAAPDGYTLLVSADTTFVMNPHLYNKLGYDPVNDFIAVSGLGISPQALVVHPSVPAQSLKELIELAKKKPGEINYGTFGAGSSGHLNIELLQSMTGAKFTAVHYKGATPAITDVMGNHILMMIVSIGLVAQLWQAGKLRFSALEAPRAFRNIPTCRRLPKAAYPDTRRPRGMDWPRPKARRARSSTSSAPRPSASSPIRPSATDFWRQASSIRSPDRPTALPSASEPIWPNGVRSFARRRCRWNDRRARHAEEQAPWTHRKMNSRRSIAAFIRCTCFS